MSTSTSLNGLMEWITEITKQMYIYKAKLSKRWPTKRTSLNYKCKFRCMLMTVCVGIIASGTLWCLLAAIAKERALQCTHVKHVLINDLAQLISEVLQYVVQIVNKQGSQSIARSLVAAGYRLQVPLGDDHHLPLSFRDRFVCLFAFY